MVKNAHFYHFSQTTSDCHFLWSLSSFRKRKKHENNEYMVNMFIFITFYKLRQTVTFCGRYLASQNVTIMKIIKIW